MRECTVVIPTWNMGRFLEPLFNSIVASAFANDVEEIIFVCEKSDDESEAVVESLIRRQGDSLPRVRLIVPERRRGNFVGRYIGAKAARTPKLFFIDSRITLPKSTGDALPRLIRQYPALCSVVDIDIHKNLYCLYWQRSHETVFRRTYLKNAEGPVTVTAENFRSHKIGGTSFFCSREPFVRLCEKYMDPPLYSDDTYLMADLVEEEPITVHPEYRINWEPRDNWRAFLRHLYMRGPGFAQYNLFREHGTLFWAVMTGVTFLIACLVLLFTHPLYALALAASGVLALLLSTAFFVKTVGEFFRLAPLHAGTVLAYGFGSLRGAWIVWKTAGLRGPRALADEKNTAA